MARYMERLWSVIALVTMFAPCGCVDPTTLPNGGGSQASVLGPDASRTEKILKAASDIERAARATENPTEEIRLWREVDAEPDASIAFAGVPMTANSIQNNNYHYGTLSAAQEYANGLAQARVMIGNYYQNGVAVRQDYAEAAAWYQKASNTTDPTGERTLFGNVAAKNLGLLYAYGLGVPQNRATARQLWETWPAGSGGNRGLLRLLDADALPKTMVGNDHFWDEVNSAVVEVDADDARKQAAAEQQRQKEAAADLEKYIREHPPQRITRSECIDRCRGEYNSCRWNNQDYQAWSGFGGALGGMAAASIKDCNGEASSCASGCPER
jgi:hypothetical protein